MLSSLITPKTQLNLSCLVEFIKYFLFHYCRLVNCKLSQVVTHIMHALSNEINLQVLNVVTFEFSLCRNWQTMSYCVSQRLISVEFFREQKISRKTVDIYQTFGLMKFKFFVKLGKCHQRASLSKQIFWKEGKVKILRSVLNKYELKKY